MYGMQVQKLHSLAKEYTKETQGSASESSQRDSFPRADPTTRPGGGGAR